MPTPDPILDALGRAVPISIRRMFGCVGVYSDGAFFAIVSSQRLFFKVDATTQPAYQGMAPFSPQGRTSHNYYEVPDDVIDDPTALRDWADASIAAARRTAS